MPTPVTEIAKARALPFVADLQLSQSGHFYMVELRYDYPAILPIGKNYLAVNATGFTAEAVTEAFRLVIVEFFRREYEKAQALYKLAKEDDFGDIMNEL